MNGVFCRSVSFETLWTPEIIPGGTDAAICSCAFSTVLQCSANCIFSLGRDLRNCVPRAECGSNRRQRVAGARLGDSGGTAALDHAARDGHTAPGTGNSLRQFLGRWPIRRLVADELRRWEGP